MPESSSGLGGGGSALPPLALSKPCLASAAPFSVSREGVREA
jgi:hypothetical protein